MRQQGVHRPPLQNVNRNMFTPRRRPTVTGALHSRYTKGTPWSWPTRPPLAQLEALFQQPPTFRCRRLWVSLTQGPPKTVHRVPPLTGWFVYLRRGTATVRLSAGSKNGRPTL